MACNGYRNYQTWNVALWIANDEGLYNLAKEVRFQENPYSSFQDHLKELGDAIGFQTPDNIAWNDSAIDIDAINEMIRNL